MIYRLVWLSKGQLFFQREYLISPVWSSAAELGLRQIWCMCSVRWDTRLYVVIRPDVPVTNFFIIKPTRCTNFTNLFWHETLHVSDSSSLHHQEFVHYTLICSCLKAVYKPVWHIPLLSVQRTNSWLWRDELSETCRVSCQNKFVKFVHLVGFIIKKFVTMHGHMNVKYLFSLCPNA